MSWRKELVSLVMSDATVKGLIGNRFYAGKAPVKATASAATNPFAIYRTVSNRPSNHKSGPSTLEFRTVEIAAHAETLELAEEIYRAIRAKIDNHSSTTGEIRRIVYQIDTELFDEDNRLGILNADYLLTLQLE